MDAATQTFGFIARKGAGKTYAAGKLTELLLDAGVQVIVLDTVGNWFGLRLAADGKGDGFDIPVLGGLRGDIPLNAAAGELVADLAVDTGRSLILDLSQFSLADRRRFATAFGVRLWQRKKGEREPTPLHLVIEESQLIIPQDVRGDAARMVGIFEEIVRLGRNYGIGVSLISQRPQSVNKEALNQVECLLAFQVNGTHERKALRDGPCIPAPRPMQASRGKRSDPLRYADIEADLERAWCRLGRWSLEARAVEAKMAGQSLHHLARAIQRRDKDVYGAYWEGVKQMAKTLGWVAPKEERR